MKTKSRIIKAILLLSCFSLQCVKLFSQSEESYDIRTDIVDVYNKVFFPKKTVTRTDTVRKIVKKLHSTVIPAPGYAIQNGFNFNITNTNAFYASETANISNVMVVFTYTQKKQTIVPIQSVFFTHDNKWCFQGDWRYMKYPIPTYGLGNHTYKSDAVALDYSYLYFNELALKKIFKNFYAGAGYNLSRYWNITQGVKDNTSTFYNAYGFTPNATSSGFVLSGQYDSREDLLNPGRSNYFNCTFIDNMTELGSNTSWTSLLIDARTFFHFPAKSKNIIAFWSYNWLTLTGRPPYLDLPSNGWDTYFNTTRGYAQGRYRGMGMIDFETEYRIHLMKNDLIGMVVFGNVQSYSTMPRRFYFDTAIPGGGIGLRFKFNKFSNVNVAVDYGIGINGSNGVFFALGEIF